jgi:hypothetical protein
MSPQSGRKILSPAKAGSETKGDLIPGFRFAPPGAIICHPLRGFIG